MGDTKYRDRLAAWLEILWKGINPVDGSPFESPIMSASSISYDTIGGILVNKDLTGQRS